MGFRWGQGSFSAGMQETVESEEFHDSRGALPYLSHRLAMIHPMRDDGSGQWWAFLCRHCPGLSRYGRQAPVSKVWEASSRVSKMWEASSRVGPFYVMPGRNIGPFYVMPGRNIGPFYVMPRTQAQDLQGEAPRHASSSTPGNPKSRDMFTRWRKNQKKPLSRTDIVTHAAVPVMPNALGCNVV